MIVALLLAGAALAWFLQKWLFRRFWQRGLTVRVDFADGSACEGDVCTLLEEITNEKRMPLPALEVRLVLSRNLKFSGDAAENSNITDQSYRRDVFSLFSRQKVIRRLSFCCTRRGCYAINRVEAVASDFFYGGGYYLEIPQSSAFYVYPRPVDIRRIRLLCQAISGMILVQNRLYPDPFEFAGIREYRPTDPMRSINWKASARGQELMVNQYDSTTSVQVCIWLDAWDTGALKYEDLTEEAIRIAASLTQRLVSQNMEAELISNGCAATPGGKMSDTDGSHAESAKPPHARAISGANAAEIDAKTAFTMHLKPGAGRIPQLLRGLACLDTSLGTENSWELLEKAAASGRADAVHVFLSHDQSERTVAAARKAAAAGNRLLWVLPVSSRAKRSVPEIPGVQILEWEAENI